MWSIKQILKIYCVFAFCCSNSWSLKVPKLWTYEFVSLYTNSSNESIIKIEVGLKRVGRGNFILTGQVAVNIDIYPDTDFWIEIYVYRSATGTSEYKRTPFAVRKMHFIRYLDTFYKDLLMESLHKCSNAPYFKNKFDPPFRKNLYYMNNCTFDDDGFPPTIPEGYYKFDIRATGIVNAKVEYIVSVVNDV